MYRDCGGSNPFAPTDSKIYKLIIHVCKALHVFLCTLLQFPSHDVNHGGFFLHFCVHTDCL